MPLRKVDDVESNRSPAGEPDRDQPAEPDEQEALDQPGDEAEAPAASVDTDRGWETPGDADRDWDGGDGGSWGSSGESTVWDPRTGTWQRESELTVAGAGRSPHAPAPSGGLRSGLIGGVVGATLAALAVFGLMQFLGRPGPAGVEFRQAPSIAASNDTGASIIKIADGSRPSVVNINTVARQRGVFGSRQSQGTGSGVIIRTDGHIITNAHVVEGAERVEVTLASGRSLEARVVGVDPDTDVAVIKVEGRELPAITIGDAEQLRVGELAVAIGSPLGLEQSVTAGIISALGRTTEGPSGRPLVDMIQTDAAVTQGNSGGALLNSQGALIGINSSIAASPQVGAEGIAFAIPVYVAKRVADEIITSGRATHPWLGISGSSADREVAKQFGIEEGAVIQEVVQSGPAAQSGIRQGDIVVRFQGKSVKSMDALRVAINKGRVGDKVSIELVRDGKKQSVEATLGDRPRDQ
ncbi:MAG TPA: trypsin-like peptidase domain-containing protein [Actinomycetota bacterium]|nr:trypsin-like peptidase domain-containing protein [Actinomycetota bacterium]